MIHPERIPHNEAEGVAIDKLLDENPDASISLTRRDPGDTGPLLVHIDDNTYLIDEDGKRQKQRKAAS